MKNKRFLIVAMLCVVMLFSLIVFVACDDNNNSDDNADYGELFVDIDEDMLYKSLNGFIGYAFKNTVSDNENEIIEACMDSSGFLNDPETVGEKGYIGNMMFGIVAYDTRQSYDMDMFTINNIVDIVFYDTEENAKIALPLIEQKLGDENTSFEEMIRAYQIGSVIVAESKEGFFDELMTYDIPSEKKDDKALKFFINMFNKEMHGDNREVWFVESGCLIIQNGEIVRGGCWAMPASGNREKTYEFCSYDYIRECYKQDPDELVAEASEAINSGYYTDDSYAKTEKINNKNYFVCYSQPKEGIIYQENDYSCTIIGIYFDGTSVNIPSERNGKPVKIDYFINSVEGLTDVYFDGTKAQWEEISQNSSRWSSAVVHCSDGIIENEPQ